MRQDYTHIVIVRDCSSSMTGIAKAMDEELNTLLDEQKRADGYATLSLYDFSSDSRHYFHGHSRELGRKPVRRIFDFVPLSVLMGVEPLSPHGNTPLWDAVGDAIEQTGETLANMLEDQRPAKVIVVVITDGEENDSERYDEYRVNQMIKEQTNKYKWQFTFIGANQNSYLEASRVGIKAQSALNFAATSGGVRNAMGSLSKGLLRARSMDHESYCSSVDAGSFYTEEEQTQGDNDVEAASGDNLQGSAS